MNILSLATLDAFVLAGLFALSGGVHLSGAGFIQRAYVRWGFPGKFYRISGLIQLLAALFLANAITRVWGVALAALITFMAVVLLLSRGRYRTSLPGMLVLMALVPAILAGPL